MANWKKRNGNTVQQTINMSVSEFNKLEAQAELGRKIDMLSEDVKKVVKELLEVL